MVDGAMPLRGDCTLQQALKKDPKVLSKQGQINI